MGSPPKRLQPLIESDKSSLSTHKAPGLGMSIKHATMKGRRILGNLSSVRLGDHPAVYGPHQFVSSCRKVNSEKLRRSRPLSSLRTLKNTHNEEAVDLFSIERKEQKARATPYLKHMKRQQREEVLMELGSIVNTIDEELSLEIKLQSMLSDILQEPRRKEKGNNRTKTELKETRKIIDIEEQCSDGDSLGSHHSSQLSSPYDVDTLHEDDAGISSYSPINFRESDENSADVVDKLRADWGFEGFEIDPNASTIENRNSRLGIGQIISEFDSTQNYHDEFINISPKASTDEFSFGPDIVGSFAGQYGAPEDDYEDGSVQIID